MYYYDNPANEVAEQITGIAIWTIVSLVLAVVGGIVVYFVFFKSDKPMPNKFLESVRSFFNFQTMLIEDMLKVVYIVLAFFITLISFSFITVNFFSFILTLVLGNILLRIAFELGLIKIMIWKNTNEINKKIKKQEK